MATKTPGRPRTSETRDLRESLLRTSRELLDEGGPAMLSMREVTHRAGCTHQAPYHYFTNHETILAVLVRAGLDELANRLREARDKAGTEGLKAMVEASGNTYAEFALTNPGVFRVMSHRDMCSPAQFPGVLATGKRTHDELGRFAQAITGERVALEYETTLWVSVHGLAVLLLGDLVTDELLALEYRLAYARRVDQLGAGAPMSSGKSKERDDPGAWFW